MVLVTEVDFILYILIFIVFRQGKQGLPGLPGEPVSSLVFIACRCFVSIQKEKQQLGGIKTNPRTLTHTISNEI